MTAPPKLTAKQREIERVREELRRTTQLAHEAVDALDPGAVIAHARARLSREIPRAGAHSRASLSNLPEYWATFAEK